MAATCPTPAAGTVIAMPGLARVKAGLDEALYLGNLEAKRDWGHARDYVEGMWRILQHDEPDDFVLATGETHSVREFVEVTAEHLGFDLKSHLHSMSTTIYNSQ